MKKRDMKEMEYERSDRKTEMKERTDRTRRNKAEHRTKWSTHQSGHTLRHISGMRPLVPRTNISEVLTIKSVDYRNMFMYVTTRAENVFFLKNFQSFCRRWWLKFS